MISRVRTSSRRAPLIRLVVMVGAVLLVSGGNESVAVPERGRPAPAFRLTDLAGRSVDLADFPDTTLVLVFGEIYHPSTREAVQEIRRLLEDPRLAGERINPLLIVARDQSAAELQREAREAKLELTVLHDPKRKAFGDYRIAVMPSTVIIDPEKKVVIGLAGKMARFGDIVRDALLVAVGKLGEDDLTETLRPSTDPARSSAEIRAERLARLGDQLVRRKLHDLAQEKYLEALEVVPDFPPARLGMGKLMLDRNRIADAEVQFRAALFGDPDSVEAALGLGYVVTLRGGDELADAERIVRGVLARHEREPRAHYLLGLIHEQRDDLEQAAASFKRAAELLMER